MSVVERNIAGFVLELQTSNEALRDSRIVKLCIRARFESEKHGNDELVWGRALVCEI